MVSYSLTYDELRAAHGITYSRDGWFLNRDGSACKVVKRKMPRPSPADVLVYEYPPDAFDGHASHSFPTEAEWPSDASWLMNKIEMGCMTFAVKDGVDAEKFLRGEWQ